MWTVTRRGDWALELLERDPHASTAHVLHELERGDPRQAWQPPPVAWLR